MKIFAAKGEFTRVEKQSKLEHIIVTERLVIPQAVRYDVNRPHGWRQAVIPVLVWAGRIGEGYSVADHGKQPSRRSVSQHDSVVASTREASRSALCHLNRKPTCERRAVRVRDGVERHNLRA